MLSLRQYIASLTIPLAFQSEISINESAFKMIDFTFIDEENESEGTFNALPAYQL